MPSIADSVTLPDLENPGRTLWPPPRPSPALHAAPPPYDPRFSEHWGELKIQEEQVARDNAEREAREREAAAIASQEASGAPVWWKRDNAAAE